MQTEPVDPDDVYQSLAVRLIRAVNSYDPCKGYLKEYILSQLKREMVRIRSTQTVYGLTQAPANIGSTIVPLTIAAQRESYWETYSSIWRWNSASSCAFCSRSQSMRLRYRS